MKTHLALFLCLLFLLITLFALSAEKRTALVIGNSSYRTVPLKNPVNDAKDITEALKDLGFTVITLIDVSHQEMYQAIRDFGKELARTDVGLFYYAGHGIQVDGVNYLIPLDADIQVKDEVKFNCIDANLVLSKMESAGNNTNIIILDACRVNPFDRFFRAPARGLAVVEAPSGSLVVYATAPGATAAEGRGRNGIFTGVFLRYSKDPRNRSRGDAEGCAQGCDGGDGKQAGALVFIIITRKFLFCR